MILNENLSRDDLAEHLRLCLRQAAVVTLRRGEHLYRYASSDRPPARWPASGWWIREADFQLIRQRQTTSRLSPGLSARVSLAVKQSWGNRMDILLKAVTLTEIKAFAGRARTQYREQGNRPANRIGQGPQGGQSAARRAQHQQRDRIFGFSGRPASDQGAGHQAG